MGLPPLILLGGPQLGLSIVSGIQQWKDRSAPRCCPQRILEKTSLFLLFSVNKVKRNYAFQNQG